MWWSGRGKRLMMNCIPARVDSNRLHYRFLIIISTSTPFPKTSSTSASPANLHKASKLPNAPIHLSTSLHHHRNPFIPPSPQPCPHAPATNSPRTRCEPTTNPPQSLPHARLRPRHPLIAPSRRRSHRLSVPPRPQGLPFRPHYMPVVPILVVTSMLEGCEAPMVRLYLDIWPVAEGTWAEGPDAVRSRLEVGTGPG